MVDSHVILARIDKIRESVGKLRKQAQRTEDAFISDSLATDSTERNLQTAIQAVIDIGNHIVADMDLGTPADYKEIFRLLAKNGILRDEQADRLISMTGLRNILVHEYLQIDLRLIYSIIRNDLDDFDQFIAAALKLI
jgi:uncharacterized protein YutE (UPF0331/DUF86 family)